MTARSERREVAVVGGGPAGAAVAIGLARAGRDVVLFERQAAYRWRACGVFSSPVTLRELRRLGTEVGAEIAHPIPALRFEARGAPAVRFAYGRRGPDDPSAVGFDRSALDPLLLDAAAAAGVDVRLGVSARVVDLEPPTLALDSGAATVRAAVVVGADGLRSTVARAAGVVARPVMPRRVGLTFHVLPDAPMVEMRRLGHAEEARHPDGKI